MLLYWLSVLALRSEVILLLLAELISGEADCAGSEQLTSDLNSSARFGSCLD